MKKIKVEDAIGNVLPHDITRIIPGVVKDTPFKKGHIIKAEDIPMLKSLGKEHIYVWENKEGMLHENEAALRIHKAVQDDNFEVSEINEGKINFIANKDGLLKVNEDILSKINSIDQIIFSTIHNNTPVKKGDKVAATRVIPLVIDEEKIEKLEEVMRGQSLITIKEFINVKVGIVTTGSEIFKGLIKDAFGPALIEKLKEYGSYKIDQVIVDDKKEIIKHEIENYIKEGYDLILCTGGMSVDPDDVTPSAIKGIGAEIITYGVPVLPGAMLLVAYYGDKTIIGLPGCVMYSKRTSFDLVLPKVLAGEKISKEELVKFGHGGLCRSCDNCVFPYCSFGK